MGMFVAVCCSVAVRVCCTLCVMQCVASTCVLRARVCCEHVCNAAWVRCKRATRLEHNMSIRVVMISACAFCCTITHCNTLQHTHTAVTFENASRIETSVVSLVLFYEQCDTSRDARLVTWATPHAPHAHVHGDFGPHTETRVIHRLEVSLISMQVSCLWLSRCERRRCLYDSWGDVSMTHDESLTPCAYHAGNTPEYTTPKYPTLSVAQGCHVQGARRYCAACGQCASPAPEI